MGKKNVLSTFKREEIIGVQRIDHALTNVQTQGLS